MKKNVYIHHSRKELGHFWGETLLSYSLMQTPEFFFLSRWSVILLTETLKLYDPNPYMCMTLTVDTYPAYLGLVGETKLLSPSFVYLYDSGVHIPYR